MSFKKNIQNLGISGTLIDAKKKKILVNKNMRNNKDIWEIGEFSKINIE